MKKNNWQETARRLHHRFISWPYYETEDKRFLSLALCGETGELANLIKKEWRGDKISNQDIGMELADIRIYLELLADSFGFDLDLLVKSKLIEVEKRLEEKEG